MSHPKNHFKPLSASESAQLDSLRGASAIAVVIGHTNQALIAPTYGGASPYLGLLAQCAVMVFFVLSGFLIGKSISSNIAKHHGRVSLGKFVGDRVVRIWPPLLFSIVLVIVLSLIAPYVFPSMSREFLPGHSLIRQALTFDAKQLMGAAFALNGYFTDTPDANGPLWSLSIEVWYYILAAIVVMPRRWWKLLSVPATIALFVVGWNNAQFFYYLPVWWAGYLLSVLHDRVAVPPSKYLWAVVVACLLAAIVFGSRSLMLGKISGSERQAWHFLVFFNIATGFECCALLALILRGRVAIPTIFKPAAAYSYTLYIVHVPILLFVFGITQPWIEGSLGASLLASTVSILGVIALSRWVAMAVENRHLIKSVFFRVPAHP